MTLLEIENLENRDYIHGTATVRAVTKELVEQYGNLTHLNIKLIKPLRNRPILYIGAATEKPNAIGTFVVGEQLFNFYLIDSDVACESFKVFKEHAFDETMLGDVCEVKWDSKDDIFIGWHLLLKQRGFELMQSLNLVDDKKQLWFTGAEIYDPAALLNATVETIGFSYKATILSTYKFQRDMYLNGRKVGTRTAVYA